MLGTEEALIKLCWMKEWVSATFGFMDWTCPLLNANDEILPFNEMVLGSGVIGRSLRLDEVRRVESS